MKATVEIWDIDGVLADSSYALECIVNTETPDWDGFYERIAQAKVNEWAKTRVNESHNDIVVITSRSECSRATTEKWLNDNDIYFGTLLMRPDGIIGHSHLVKKSLYEQYVLNGENYEKVAFAVDDDPKNIEMWESIGIQCIPILSKIRYSD